CSSVHLCCGFFSVFFFQAEDGIRDPLVTGVQTCALPIWIPTSGRVRVRRGGGSYGGLGAATAVATLLLSSRTALTARRSRRGLPDPLLDHGLEGSGALGGGGGLLPSAPPPARSPVLSQNRVQLGSPRPVGSSRRSA